MSPRELIVTLMAENHLTQAMLARKSGKSYQAIGKSIKVDDKMRVETFLELIKYLGCELIVRDHNHYGTEWRLGDGIWICESEYKRASNRRKWTGSAGGGTDEERLSEDIQRKLHRDERESPCTECTPVRVAGGRYPNGDET